MLAEQPRHLALVRRVRVAVHQCHGGMLDAQLAQLLRHGHDLGLAQLLDLASGGIQPARYLPRHLVKARARLVPKRKEVRPPLVADLQQIAEAAGDNERHARALSLQERVRRARRREAELHRRELASQAREREQPRAEHRRLIAAGELGDLPRLDFARQRQVEPQAQPAVFRGARLDHAPLGGMTVECQAKSGEEARRHVPRILQAHRALVRHPAGARAQHAR